MTGAPSLHPSRWLLSSAMSTATAAPRLTPFSELLASFKAEHDDADLLLAEAGDELMAAERDYLRSNDDNCRMATDAALSEHDGASLPGSKKRRCGTALPDGGTCAHQVVHGTPRCAANHPVSW